MAMQGELLRSLRKKPITLRYPFERVAPPEGFRGKHNWNAEKCIGCGICVRDCPSFAIEMIGKGLTAEFKVYLDRCTFCGQCEESCPKGAIKLTTEYELAAYTRDQLIQEWKRPPKSESTT
ncbi:NADH-quinone oxidoreductase subunit I [Candidatus Bathyarchaeota archaeon]|nr:NADH-quinone oxidoreductase subunit I [Candidatus Bathyarchaeota archaeon]